MEIVIALILVACVVYYLFRKYNESESELNQAPYKAEAPTMEPVKVETPEPVVTAPVAVEEIQWPKLASTNSQITDSVTQAPVKKPRRPRQNKPPVKQPTKPATQKAPAIQAAPKARKPRSPASK